MGVLRTNTGAESSLEGSVEEEEDELEKPTCIPARAPGEVERSVLELRLCRRGLSPSVGEICIQYHAKGYQCKRRGERHRFVARFQLYVAGHREHTHRIRVGVLLGIRNCRMHPLVERKLYRSRFAIFPCFVLFLFLFPGFASRHPAER